MASKESATTTCETPRINVKKCGQCEEIFSKKQKAMNCNICKYWFCLECSHVSSKLYDALKNESSANLPFNCDGCVRLLPSLTDIAARCKSFEEKIISLESSIDDKIKTKVESSIEEFKEREERKCNVIIHNITEPVGEDKKAEDMQKVEEIFKVIKCEDVVVKGFLRLGKPVAGRKRLVKVMVDTVSSKHQILGGDKTS